MNLISNQRFLRFLWVYIVILGLVFVFIIPPFQKTDEVSHYYKTVAVATSNFFCQKSTQNQPQNLIPKSLFDLPEKMMVNFINENPQHRFPKGAILPTLKEKYDGRLVSENISCTLPFIFYLPSVLMLALPIFLKLNPLIVFYLGRLSFYLISILLFYVSLKIIPKKFQLLLLSCLSLPMVIIQMSSYNKEVFHLGFGALSLSLFLSLKNKFDRRNLFFFLTSLVFFILPRPQYSPFFLLIFLVFDRQIKLKIIALIGLLGTGIIGIGFYFQKIVLLGSNTLARPQLLYLKMFPQNFFSVLFNSYTNHIEAYYKSLIGTFGSIHFYLDWYVYVFYGLLLCLTIYSYIKVSISLRFRELLFIAFIVSLTVFLTFFSMYLYATPVAFPYIVDVQGRYFIMILPYLIIIAAKIIKKFGIKLIYFGFIFVTLFLLKNTYDRYFDYSQAYYYDFSTFKNAKILSINKKIQHKLEIDFDKKLIGLHLIVDNKRPNLTDWPILITFYKNDCHTELRKVIIGNSIVSQNYRDFIFSPPLKNISSICYVLEPFEAATFKNGLFFYQPPGLPIYAF